MKELQQISSPPALHHLQKSYWTASKFSSSAMLPPPFITSPVTSSLPFLLSSPPKYLPLWTPSKLHVLTATYIWASLLYTSLKYFFHVLHTWSSPSPSLPFPSFIVLQLPTFPPFTLLTSFQNSFSPSILIHFPSKLFINLLFAMINTPFNRFLFFVDLHPLSFATSSLATTNTSSYAFYFFSNATLYIHIYLLFENLISPQWG